MKGSSIRKPTRERWVFSASDGFLVSLLLFLGGCSYLEPVAEPAGPTVFDIGLADLADGDYAGAEVRFRDAASRCESGLQGRRALLFLSFLALDPRNPAAHPDSAALMAARVLNLPGKTREETLEAEALYIAALDYGANPELELNPEDPGFAVRFGDCDQPFPVGDYRPLPVLENPTSGLLRSLDEEKSTLTQENQQLLYTVRRLRLSSDSLQAQVDTLQAELNRIRQLIRLPDTSMVRRPPDTGSVRPSDTTFSRILGADSTQPPGHS